MRLFHKKRKEYDDPFIVHIYLHNALHLIDKGEYDAAYEAICWAVIKSNGVIKDKEANKFNKLRKKRLENML